MAEEHPTFCPLPSNPRFKNLAGRRFGKLTVLGYAGRIISGTCERSAWWCRCDCGALTRAGTPDLTTGHTASCGCHKRSVLGKASVRHGGARRGRRIPEYSVWCAMIARCCRENHSQFHLYGGRGITVCARWRESFEDFLTDMGPRPSPRHTIEREKNQEGYGPGNCHWATAKEQGRNKRNNHLITFRGETLCLAAWAERTGISRGTLFARIKRSHWPVEKALTQPVRKPHEGFSS